MWAPQTVQLCVVLHRLGTWSADQDAPLDRSVLPPGTLTEPAGAAVASGTHRRRRRSPRTHASSRHDDRARLGIAAVGAPEPDDAAITRRAVGERRLAQVRSGSLRTQSPAGAREHAPTIITSRIRSSHRRLVEQRVGSPRHPDRRPVAAVRQRRPRLAASERHGRRRPRRSPTVPPTPVASIADPIAGEQPQDNSTSTTGRDRSAFPTACTPSSWSDSRIVIRAASSGRAPAARPPTPACSSSCSSSAFTSSSTDSTSPSMTRSSAWWAVRFASSQRSWMAGCDSACPARSSIRSRRSRPPFRERGPVGAALRIGASTSTLA